MKTNKYFFKTISMVLTVGMLLSVFAVPAFAFDKEPNTVDPPSLQSLRNDPNPSKQALAIATDNSTFDLGPKLYGKAENVGPPKMGWNSWNAFWTQVNQWNVLGIAESFVRLGLKDVGYEYVVVDDGNFAGSSLWNQRVTTRNPANGNRIEENLIKFPAGFKKNVDDVHALGLKYGMYGDVGTATCNGYHVGTWGYEDLDALTYAEWGVDYIKYDTCNNVQEGTARRCYSPYIRSFTLSSGSFSEKTLATAGERKGLARLGTGANANDVYYIGAGTKIAGFIDCGEVTFTVTVPEDGNYKIELEHAGVTNGATGAGRWVSIDVNGNGNRLIDQFVPATANTTTFATTDLGNIPLKAGENTLRFCNFGRMDIALYQYGAFADAMAKATKQTGHEMVLSLCEWGNNWPWAWGYLMSDSWRTTNDVMLVRAGGHSYWKSQFYNDGANTTNSYSVIKCYNENVILDEYAGIDRGWNDADMLVVGTVNLNHATGSSGVWPQGIDIYNKFSSADYVVGELAPNGTTVYVPGTTTAITVSSQYRNPNTIPNDRKWLSFEQEESHFNSWAIMNSVLMMGFDLRTFDKEDYSIQIVGNKDVIDLNQDLLGVQAKRVKIDNPAHAPQPAGSSTSAASIQHLDALAKPLANGDIGLMFFNTDDVPRTITLTMDEMVNNKDTFWNNSIAPKIVNKDGKLDNGRAFLAADSYTIQDLSARGTRTDAIINEGPPREWYRGDVVLRTRSAQPVIAPRKAPVTVDNNGTFVLSEFDSVAYVSSNTAPNRPTEYSSLVTYENGEFQVSLAPHASAIYRISYNEGFAYDSEYLVTGNTTTATATYNNTSADDIDVFVVLARYDGEGRLVDTVIGGTVTIEKGTMASIELAYDLPADAGGHSLSAFLWEAVTYRPLTNSIGNKIYDYTPASKTALGNAISRAEGYDLDLYSLATGGALADAITSAKAVYANERAAQAVVDAAVDAISTAINGLATAPRIVLAERIAYAKGIDLSEYSEASSKRLTDAIAAGEAVLAKAGATEPEFEESFADLNAAISGLATATRIVLGERITEAKAINLSSYNLLSGELLTIAIASAELVYSNPLATEADAETALTALQATISGLVRVIVIDLGNAGCYSYDAGNLARHPEVFQEISSSVTATNRASTYNRVYTVNGDNVGITASFTSTTNGNNNVFAYMNNGLLVGETQTGIGTSNFNTYGVSAANQPTYAVLRWSGTHTIDSTRVMWWYDGTAASSGVTLPAAGSGAITETSTNRTTIQYWNLTNSRWENVANLKNASGTSVENIGVAGGGTNNTNRIWNGVTFDPVATDRVRLVIQKGVGNSTGIGEWEVFGGLGSDGPDRSLLDYRIATAEGMEESEWTIETWTVLMNAVTAAKALPADADQAAINTATATITAAIAALNPT